MEQDSPFLKYKDILTHTYDDYPSLSHSLQIGTSLSAILCYPQAMSQGRNEDKQTAYCKKKTKKNC